MKLEFSQTEVNDYIKNTDDSRHYFYKTTVEIAESMATHADGRFPEKLIAERRPNEPDEVLAYRKSIFIAKTKPVFTRVISSLMKIRRSTDWKIEYKEESDFPLVREQETLENYLEHDFPYFTSVTNWAFSELLRKTIIDPNAVLFVRPLSFDVEETDYLKPYPYIFPAAEVLDYVEDDYAVLRNPEGSKFYIRNKIQTGESYYFVTSERIFKYDQIDSKKNFDLTLDYEHGLGMLPVFKIGGILIDRTDNYALYESLLSGMVPELDEAIREYSDLQAAMVTSAYPERWEYAQNECLTCKGTPQRMNPAYTGVGCGQSEFLTCNDCGGRGYAVAGPYSKIIVRPVNNAVENGSQIPSPPGGHLEKDVEIIKLQTESVDRHIYNALAAHNFQFLDQSPLNVSGAAKEIDKDELNNQAHAVAERMVQSIDNYILITARYRYKSIYAFDEIDEMLPTIAVPERFDLIGSSNIGAELKEAKDANLNPVILNEMEKDYAGKKYYSDPDVAKRLSLVLQLDPLPNVTEENKMIRLSNKGISQETYVISSNIQEFVNRAMEEVKDFEDKPVKEQKAVLLEYAKAITTAEVENIINDVQRDIEEDRPIAEEVGQNDPANAAGDL